MGIENINQAFEDLNINIEILIEAFKNILEKFEPMTKTHVRKISYKSQYHKITRNNSLNIKINTYTYGSNANAKYLMER